MDDLCSPVLEASVANCGAGRERDPGAATGKTEGPRRDADGKVEEFFTSHPRRTGVRRLWQRTADFWREGGVSLVAAKACRFIARKMAPSFAGRSYRLWQLRHEPLDVAEARSYSVSLPWRPLVSIVTPVYNTPAAFLRRAIESVLAQTYDNWELCLTDDASSNPGVLDVLREYGARDARIKVLTSSARAGISAASNKALAAAAGEFITLLDHDDEIPCNALYEVVKLLNAHRDADLIYTDEDKLDENGRRLDPLFKPDWSPELFRSMCYLTHLTTLRADLVRELGGFRSEFDFSQDYDLLLRVSEKSLNIHHIPKVLYHWRMSAASTALTPHAKMDAHGAARRALEAHLQRQGLDGKVEPAGNLGTWHVRFNLTETPRVTIIIPSGGRADLLTTCIQGLAGKTTYRPFEVLVVDNSAGDAIKPLVERLRSTGTALRYFACPDKPFNFSKLMNRAVRQTDAPLLLFLNDDTCPINAAWLGAMVEQMAMPKVGVVGPLLLYPSGRIQHAGIVMGLNGVCCDHLRRGQFPSTAHGHESQLVRNYSAVTGACLLTRRDLFLELGGFEELHLPINYQDVDYCLRVNQQGYRVVYTPLAQLTHFEQATRPAKKPFPSESRYMYEKWSKTILLDPFYSGNIIEMDTNYLVRQA